MTFDPLILIPVILAYLIGAVDIPFADKLVKPQALPTGEFFFRGLHSIPVEKLEKAFGQCPEDLYKAIECLKARRCEFGARVDRQHWIG